MLYFARTKSSAPSGLEIAQLLLLTRFPPPTYPDIQPLQIKKAMEIAGQRRTPILPILPSGRAQQNSMSRTK
jgi:hypothetical protein